MILNTNDPSGFGLFSRYARNLACKSINTQSKKLKNKRKQSSSIVSQNKDKKNQDLKNYFSKQQSRQQRQKRYKKQQTPPVGKYNPIVKEKPKMVWDFLKVYHKQKESSIKKQKTTQQSKPHTIQFIEKQQNIQEKQNTQSQSLINKNYLTEAQQKNIQNKKVERPKKLKTQGCIDMSRMTGRAFSYKTNSFNDSIQLDVNKSIEYIKSKTTVNFSFNKQMSRTKANKNSQPRVGREYDYDYSLIRPKYGVYMKFKKIKVQKQQNLAYSYVHYDYNQYVWNKSSHVFPNTKTSVTDFKKQIDRKI